MKRKSSIFWWFKRRKRTIPIAAETENTKNKQDIIRSKKQVEFDTPIELNKENENATISPIPQIINIEKENSKKIERELPPKKNERVTLIKPKRIAPIENAIEKEKKDLKLQEDKQEREEISKNTDIIDNKSISSNATIASDTLDEIEKMLKTNYYEIQNIQYELEVLEQKEQDEVVTSEIENLIEELNKLIKRFEDIKKEFYQKNFEEIYNHSTSDNYIGQLIEEYKISLKENNKDNHYIYKIKQIEEYINLINDIIDIETKKDNLNKTLNDKKDTLEIRDKDFEQLKDKYVDIDKMNNYIESFSLEYNHIIKNIEAKVLSATNITKTAEYKSELAVNYAKLLTSTLLLATTSAIPFSKGGNILKMGLMMASVAGIASSFRVKTKESKVITKVDFIDYKKEILSNINSVQDMSLMIDKTMIDIKNIKDEFQKEFSEYINLIPEYYEMMANLDSIQKDLLVKQSLAKDYDKKLEDILEQNNVKVKRLEEEILN